MATKPKDSREFVRISTTLPDDPKLADIDSPNAGWLYVTSICWSDAQKTDGHVTPRTVERKAGVAGRWSRELVRVGLWHAPGHDCPSCPQPEPGKVVIHDYLEHQRSKAEAGAAREAGRAAAEARWNAKGNAKRNADRIPNGIADSNAKGNAGGNAPPNADRNAEVEVEVEEEVTTDFVSGSPGQDPSSSSVPERVTKIDGPTTDEIIGWTTTAAPDGVDLAAEAAAFQAINAGRWSEIRNRSMAWHRWLVKAEERNRPTPTPGTPTCPLHPDQPTGSKACPRCAAENGPPPASLRDLRDSAREAS